MDRKGYLKGRTPYGTDFSTSKKETLAIPVYFIFTPKHDFWEKAEKVQNPVEDLRCVCFRLIDKLFLFVSNNPLKIS